MSWTTARSAASRTCAAWAGLAVLLVALPACDGTPAGAEDAIDRAIFVETFIDLRETEFRGDPERLTDAERAEVLARHGVTEDALLHFVEVHGRDLDFMKEVWDEVERRLEESQMSGPSAR